MKNPFASANIQQQPVLTLSVMALALGVMFGFAIVTNQAAKDSEIKAPERSNSIGVPQLAHDLEKLQSQVEELRTKNTQYEKTLAEQSGEAKALGQSLQEMKIAAGYTDVTGPGAVVTLVDSQKPEEMPGQNIVHDYDVMRVCNELWNAGAEAIAVNNQRVVVNTSFRCVGTVIRVNDIPLAPPYEIMAIGDPKTLAGALALPGGVVEEIKMVDPKMVSIKQAESLRLPAFSGSGTYKYVKVPEVKAKK